MSYYSCEWCGYTAMESQFLSGECPACCRDNITGDQHPDHIPTVFHMPKYVKYPDSEEGARQFIRDETYLKLTDKSTIEPDRVVRGCWKITNLSEKNGLFSYSAVIIYMAGYNDPLYNIRKKNDFECLEENNDRK